jgi:hypothetical protein
MTKMKGKEKKENSYTRAVEEGREKEDFKEYPVKKTIFGKITYK